MAVMPSVAFATRLAAVGSGRIDVHIHAFDPDLPGIGASNEGTFSRRTQAFRRPVQIILDGRLYRELDDRSWSARAVLGGVPRENALALLARVGPGN